MAKGSCYHLIRVRSIDEQGIKIVEVLHFRINRTRCAEDRILGLMHGLGWIVVGSPPFQFLGRHRFVSTGTSTSKGLSRRSSGEQ